jgi:NTP pyrophosphatase (non-canonical NTP hydrolase)
MALSVEVGEIVEHFQWLTQEESKNLSAENVAQVADEIGDTLIYLVELADKLGIDPLEAAQRKIEKNEKKYPAGVVRGRALKYSEYHP